MQIQGTYFESESTIKRPTAFTLTPVTRPPQVAGESNEEDVKGGSTRVIKDDASPGALHATED